MSRITSEQQPVFFTREKSIGFVIHPTLVNTLTSDNIREILGNIMKLPKDHIVVKDGVEIRHSLHQDQKQEIIDTIGRITRNDVEYLETAQVIDLSEHVELEYLLQNPELLKRRGWSEDELEFIQEIHATLANAQEVDKAHLVFDKMGMSEDHLSWTIVGNDHGTLRKLTIKFQRIVFAPQVDGPDEGIVVITVKKMN